MLISRKSINGYCSRSTIKTLHVLCRLSSYRLIQHTIDIETFDSNPTESVQPIHRHSTAIFPKLNLTWGTTDNPHTTDTGPPRPHVHTSPPRPQRPTHGLPGIPRCSSERISLTSLTTGV